MKRNGAQAPSSGPLFSANRSAANNTGCLTDELAQRSTVIRWFQDMHGVLKLSEQARNGKRTRTELRIPYPSTSLRASR